MPLTTPAWCRRTAQPILGRRVARRRTPIPVWFTNGGNGAFLRHTGDFYVDGAEKCFLELEFIKRVP